MGNKQSTESTKLMKNIKKTSKNENIVTIIDHIATNFILESDFQEMINLQSKSYCNKLTILTKKKILDNLTPKEIIYLDFRTKKGETKNILTRDEFSFIDSEKINKMDIKNKVKKERICLGIARFYVKFFHLFASIVKSINPVYKYTDMVGNVQHIDLLDKKSIPNIHKNDKIRVIMGICKDRYRYLSPIQETANGTIVGAKFCQKDSISICDEPGIKNLKLLYYDEYDYEPTSPTKGTYYRMSKKMKDTYQEDVNKFYRAFSGQSEVPDNIKDFCDIETFDSSKLNMCTNENKQFSYKGKNTLSLKKYGEHLRNMMKSTQDHQLKLIAIINKMFHWDVVVGKKTEKKLKIHPELNDDRLQDLINETRDLLIANFVDIEEFYKDGIKLFKAITIDKKLVREKSRINMHKNMKEKMIMRDGGISPKPPVKIPSKDFKPQDFKQQDFKHQDFKQQDFKHQDFKPSFPSKHKIKMEPTKFQNQSTLQNNYMSKKTENLGKTDSMFIRV